MPGIKNRPTPANALIKRVAAPSQGEIPDNAPYLSERMEQDRDLDGKRIMVPVKHWTKKKLEQWLAACPTELVHIQLDPSQVNEDPDRVPPFPVIYDGFPFDIPRGQSVEVPAPIAQIVKQSQRKYVTSQAAGIDLFRISARNPDGKFIDMDGGGMDATSDFGEE